MIEFKAGDFTSGKMADIFKACYMRDIAIISHKQFGKSYMIPEEFFRNMSINLLMKNKKFKEFAIMNLGSEQDFMQSGDVVLFEEIGEFFGGLIIDHWFDVLPHAIKLKK